MANLEVSPQQQAHFFGAGPVVLPQAVRQAFATAYVQVHDLRIKLFELMHRHPIAKQAINTIIANFRSFQSVPDDYEVLLCAGGARQQYEMLVTNFAHLGDLSVVSTGHWATVWQSTMAQMLGKPVASVPMAKRCTPMPECGQKGIRMQCVVTNETVDGLMLAHQRHAADRVIADVTSDMGFRYIPIQDYDVLFAATGKALGVAGMTVVIIKKDFLAMAKADLPPMQSYAAMAAHASLYATPPMICIEMLGHMVDWMQRNGGITAIEARQRRRAQKIEQLMQAYACYALKTEASLRSIHNICVDVVGDKTAFIAQAENAGIYGLEGHAALGGIRINLTHGVSDAAFENLCQFLISYGLEQSYA